MINLLPPQYKQELIRERNLRLTFILGTIVLLFSISLILVLLAVRTYIKSVEDSLKILIQTQSELPQAAEFREVSGKASSANKKIQDLRSFYENQVLASAVLEKIIQTLPGQVRLTSLSWQKESGQAPLEKGAALTGQAVISGFAPTRQVLLSFRNMLESEKGFSQVYFPPQNWIKAENIDFQATFQIEL